MATYGASIAPKVYRQLGYGLYTRTALASLLARALDAVGMQFCDAIAPYNILDPTKSEATAYTTGNYSNIFIFDFPTTEYFTLRWTGETADRQYRPCFVMSLVNPASNTAAVTGCGNQISFQLAARPNTTGFCLSDLIGFNGLRNSPASFGGFGDTVGSASTIGDLSRYLSCPAFASWKSYSTSVLSNQQNLAQVRHICAYLGPGGLMLCGGSNDQTQDKSGLFDLWNVFIFFGGERVPNRQYLAANDPELTRFCPAIQVWPTTNQNSAFRWSSAYDNQTGGARAYSIAVQFADRNSAQNAEAANVDINALDKINLAFGQAGTFPVQLSPTVIAGNPRNLLSPLVLNVGVGYEVATNYYHKRTSDLVYSLNTWEYCYYSGYFRTSDQSLPVGEVTDPDTSIKWWGHWWNDFSCACAFYLGASYTLSTTLPTKSYGGATTKTWDFSQVTWSDAVDIPIGTGIPSVVNADAYYISGTVGAFAQVTGPNQDYFQSSIGSAVASQPAIEFAFDWPSGLDPTYQVELTFSAFLRGGTENNASFTFQLQVHDTAHYQNPWVTLFSMQSAGANTGNASYNYSNRGTYRLAFGGMSETARIRFRFANVRTATSGTNPVLTQVGGISLIFKKWQ